MTLIEGSKSDCCLNILTGNNLKMGNFMTEHPLPVFTVGKGIWMFFIYWLNSAIRNIVLKVIQIESCAMFLNNFYGVWRTEPVYISIIISLFCNDQHIVPLKGHNHDHFTSTYMWSAVAQC